MIVLPNRVRVVVVVSALALAAGLLTLALMAKSAKAQGTDFNFSEPFTFSFTNPCTGEQVTGEGTARIVGNFTDDASGGFHFQAQTSTSGSGVGSPSGATYIVTGVSHDAINVRDNEYPVAFTMVQRTQYIRQGEDMPEDDLVFDMLFHFTVNANGEVTAEVGDIDPETGAIVTHQECR
jgi:hypothetical protein